MRDTPGRRFANYIGHRDSDGASKVFYKSPAVAEMGDRWATIDMVRKVGEGSCCAPFIDAGSFRVRKPRK